jgi:hypothetical protein
VSPETAAAPRAGRRAAHAHDAAFRVLDARDPEDARRWTAALQRWPDREVFAEPAYGRLLSGPGERALCAVWEGPAGAILFPFALRPLAALPWCPAPDRDAWDLATPYGYGGCFWWGRVDAERFWDAFDRWAAGARVVSAFARLSLFAEQTAPFRGEVEETLRNVVRSLDAPEEAIWMSYEHKVRKNVKRALGSGLRVEVDPDGRRLPEFLEVYHDTMRRRNASAAFFFSEEMFRGLLRELPDQLVFFHVLRGGEVVSTELVLVSPHRVYSFLGGTRESAFHLRPNDLLKHHVVLWARAAGKRHFVLGGGTAPRDGIFRYKLSFAPDGEVPFRVGRRVLDPAAYGRLLGARAEWESARGEGWAPRPGYFPAYRS